MQNREYWRSQHRVIGVYLALESWCHELDCIVLQRSHVEVFFRHERFHRGRVEWLKQDIAPWFPYLKALFTRHRYRHISSLFLSRVPLIPWPGGQLTAKERIKRLRDGNSALKIALYSEKKDGSGIPSHEQVVSYLEKLASGKMAPRR